MGPHRFLGSSSQISEGRCPESTKSPSLCCLFASPICTALTTRGSGTAHAEQHEQRSCRGRSSHPEPLEKCETWDEKIRLAVFAPYRHGRLPTLLSHAGPFWVERANRNRESTNVGIRSWFRQWWGGLARGRQPHARLLRWLRQEQVQHLLELGLSDVQRTRAVLQQLGTSAARPLHYTAVDQFDLRPEEPLPLRQIYTELKLPAVEVHLVPGPWTEALQRLVLNGVRVDAVLISHRVDEAVLAQVLPLLAQLLCREAVWREVRDAEGNVRFEPQALVPSPAHRRAA